MNIVLIGFMGSGKSRVGNLVAQKLGWPHLDTDEIIVRENAMSVAEIFQKKGELAFRHMEKKVVREVSRKDRVVISTGGGVPMDEENMAELGRNGTLVWLKVSPETVLRRTGDFSSRPMIEQADPRNSVTRRLHERAVFYSKAAIAIDTDNATPREIAGKVIAEVQRLNQ